MLPRQASGAWKEGRMMGHLQDCVRGIKCCIQQSARKGCVCACVCVCVCVRERELGFYICLIQVAQRLVLSLQCLLCFKNRTGSGELTLKVI